MDAVIFDLDDTLIDFRARKRRVIRACVTAMLAAGLPGDFARLHADFSAYYWDRIEDQRIFQKYLQERYGRVDHRVLAHAILAYRRANAALLRPYPGTSELLRRLRADGWRLALLSDAPKLEAYLRICGVGFDGLFDVIVTKDDVGAVKPDRKGFVTAARKLGVAPRRCVMVGDKGEKDIAGAKRVGMTTVHAAYSGERDSTADHTARSVAELGRILQGLRRVPHAE